MPEQILFFGIAVLVLGSAMGMLLAKNTVYSALLLVFNFLNVALIYLLLGAPFIAFTQITVYAGAIMVLFLFVIMLLGAESLSREEPLKGQRIFALVLAVVFIGEMVLVFSQYQGMSGSILADVPFVTPAEVGKALFTEYALPFEMTAAILLAAAIGAVLFTHKEKQPRKIGRISAAEKTEESS